MPSQEEIIQEFSQFIEQTLARQNQNLSEKEGVSPLPNPAYQGGEQSTQPSPGLLIPTDTVNATAGQAGYGNEDDTWPDPSIASALVASDDGLANPDSVNPVWTGSIGADVAGVLVQQAAGDTPYFAPSTVGDDQVFAKLGSDDIARWYDGMPLPVPTIPSALVASAADTPEWTSDISPGVGGVLVQQASGSTPAFVSGTSGTKAVLAITSTTAEYVAGIPVPEPSTSGDYVLTSQDGVLSWEAVTDCPAP